MNVDIGASVSAKALSSSGTFFISLRCSYTFLALLTLLINSASSHSLMVASYAAIDCRHWRNISS